MTSCYSPRFPWFGASHGVPTYKGPSVGNSFQRGIGTASNGALEWLRVGTASNGARLKKGYDTVTIALADKQVEEGRDSNVSAALNFVSKGGELLKRTRKFGWKTGGSQNEEQAHGRNIHKEKKCIVSGVYCDIPAWTGREMENMEQRAYFGIETGDRIIEFEYRNKGDKQMWIKMQKHGMILREEGYIQILDSQN
ncbi:hypothetical protein Acr_00g0011260 [Actinidia rufa]|uniref:Pleckstrin-like plant domain-containing protein n=1 Tax=Actinidia rufa TaxID=165716 RepID=A0A7J0D9F2_9ERIC|nr:hypothetical protein Acr_00g0011260 [Actinidia rufa]